MSLITTTKSRDQIIDDAISYISFSEQIDPVQVYPDLDAPDIAFLHLPMTYFRGADLGLLYSGVTALPHERIFFGATEEEGQREMSRVDLGYWNSCHAVYESDPPPRRRATYLFTIRRWRKVPPKEIRGLFRMMTGDVVELAEARIYNDACYVVERAYYERRGGRYHLVAAPEAVIPAMPVDDGENMAFHMAKSFALTAYYDWRVEFGFARPEQALVPTISVATSPVGCREAFRLRDLPPGASRRQALKHWVSAHWRKREDPLPDIPVSEHLRGAEEFRFRGLYCRIEPSRHDLMRLERTRLAS